MECPLCKKILKTKSLLKRHTANMHTDATPFKCSICGKGFKYNFNLSVHLKGHTAGPALLIVSCPVCNKGFDSERKLKKHSTVHSEARPFQCTLCSKRFKQKGNLNEHLRVHSEVPRLKCSECQQTFRLKGNLGWIIRRILRQKLQ